MRGCDPGAARGRSHTRHHRVLAPATSTRAPCPTWPATCHVSSGQWAGQLSEMMRAGHRVTTNHRWTLLFRLVGLDTYINALFCTYIYIILHPLCCCAPDDLLVSASECQWPVLVEVAASPLTSLLLLLISSSQHPALGSPGRRVNVVMFRR